MLKNETMALLGDEPIIDANKNGKNVPELEKKHSVLLHCNFVHNGYLQNSKLLYTFFSNNAFCRLLPIQPQESIRSITTDSIFDYIEIWFTDLDNSPLQSKCPINNSKMS